MDLYPRCIGINIIGFRLQNGGHDINGRINLKVIGANGSGPNSIQSSSRMELSDVNETFNDISGAYVNRVMMNGSAYNSPNLANNRRGPVIHELPTCDGSTLNPDVVPNEKFPSMPSRSLTSQNGEKDGQNDKSISNSGN